MSAYIFTVRNKGQSANESGYDSYIVEATLSEYDWEFLTVNSIATSSALVELMSYSHTFYICLNQKSLVKDYVQKYEQYRIPFV